MQNREDLHTAIRNILLPHPYYVVRWWVEEREAGYEEILEEAVDWVHQEGLGSSEADLKAVVKEVLDKIIQEGENFYKKYERMARDVIRCEILAVDEEDERKWATFLGSPYTSYFEIVQWAVWRVEEWAAAVELKDLSPEESVVYFLRGRLLRDMVEDVLSEIEVDATSKRAKEIMGVYIEKEIKKLFKKLEKGELCISSSEEFREILKTRLLEQDIFAKVKEELTEECFDWRAIEDKSNDLFDEALDYNLEKELKEKATQEAVKFLKAFEAGEVIVSDIEDFRALLQEHIANYFRETFPKAKRELINLIAEEIANSLTEANKDTIQSIIYLRKQAIENIHRISL